jgi:hypothetical protein
VRPLQLIHHRYIIKLNIQILVDALQDATDLDVVLEFHRHFVIDEGLKEAARELEPKINDKETILRSKTQRDRGRGAQE